MPDDDFLVTPIVSSAVKRSRRLTDKLLVAFHQACDQSDVDVAKRLLPLIETIVQRTPGIELRRNQESLVAAYERLWFLKHPSFHEAEQLMSVPVNAKHPGTSKSGAEVVLFQDT